jgi:hypothetical protein
VVGTQNDHTFTITNTGVTTATSLASLPLTGAFFFKDGTYPGTGGTCTDSLASGAPAACTVVVTFAPQDTNPASSTLSLTYFDGVASQEVDRVLEGQGITPAAISVSDTPTYDYLTVVDGTTSDHAFTLTNGGAATATSIGASGFGAPFTYAGGSFPGEGGTCTTSLAGGSPPCTIVVRFSPTTPGFVTGSFSVGYFDGASNQSDKVDVQGTGAAPAVLSFFDGTAFGFGTLGVGQTGEHVLHVSNDGGWPATSIAPSILSAPFAYKGGTYPGLGGTCGTSLAAGVGCTIIVDYVATSGFSSTPLALGYSDGAQGQSASITLNGTGTTAAVLAFTDFPPNAYAAYGLPPDPPTFDFGPRAVDSTTTQSFYLTNNGNAQASAIAPAALGAPFSFKGGTFPGSGGSCGATLAAGATCIVVVNFAPTTSTSPDSATLTVGYNDGTTSQSATRPLSGEVTSGALLLITDYQGISIGPAYDFGQEGVGNTTAHTFYVANQGAATATQMAAGSVAAPFGFLGTAYPGLGGTCGTALAAGSSCTIVGSFTPSATGPASGSLSVTYNDGTSAQTASRPVQGAGIGTALLTISDNQTGSTSYGFGTIPANTSTTATFTVTNTGAAVATNITQGTLSAPFSYASSGGTCTSALGIGKSCTIVVTFAPTTGAPFTGTLSLSYNDSTATQSVQRVLTGSGTTVAILSIAAYNDDNGGGFGGQYQPYDYGTSGVAIDHTFYVTNSGAQSATAVTGSATPSPAFQFKGTSFPGTGGTCVTPIPAGTTCTIVVTFTPGSATTYTGSVGLSYNDGSASQSTSLALAGEATPNALLVIEDDSGETGVNPNPYVFGTTGIPSSHTFYVTNVGEQQATSMADGATLANGFAYTGGKYPGTGGSCGATLAVGASCSVSITFTPSGSLTTSSTLTVTYSDGASPQSATRAMTGTGTTLAVLQMYQPNGGGGGNNALSFGTSGVPTTQTLGVFNGGGQAATNMGDGGKLAAPFGFAGGKYPGTGGSCGPTLAPGDHCSVTITFTPSGSGPASGTVDVAYNDGSQNQDVAYPLSGTSTSLALLSINPFTGQANSFPQSYDYGTTGAPEDHTFFVTNIGAATATSLGDAGTLGNGFAFKNGAYPGGGSCPADGTLASNSTCTIVVTFTPSGNGPSSSTITLGYNDSTQNQQATATVTGTSTTAAILQIATCQNCGGSQSSYDFGTWGTPTSQTFYVTNIGAQSATQMGDGGGLGSDFAYAGLGGNFPGTGGTCTNSLAPGATCSVVVTFNPNGSNASKGTLEVSYNDGTTTQSADVSLTGTGTSGALVQIFDYQGQSQPSFSPYDFGTVGVPQQATFYVTNTGAADAEGLGDGGTLGSGFSLAGGYPGGGTCGSTLAKGASCTVIVTFTPTGNGPLSSTLTLSYTFGSTPGSATRSLMGTATTAPVLVFQSYGGPPGQYSFGTSGIPISQTIWLQNIGGGSATSLGDGGTLSGMFSYAGNKYPGGGGTCGASLAAGASCSVVVTFKPSGSGNASSNLTLDYAGGTATLQLTGTATTSALVVVGTYSGQTSPSNQPYDFGTWGTATSQTFYLINVGANAASNLADGATLAAPFSYTGGGGFPGANGTCSSSTPLASGASCTIQITFTPSGSGPASSQLTIAYKDGTSPLSASLGLQGTSTTAAVLAITPWSGGGSSSPQTFDYGTVGAAEDHTFTVTNVGAQTATALGDAGKLAGPFAYKGTNYPGSGGTCGNSLNVGASCTVVVTFTPSGNGVSSSTLTLNYIDGSAGQQATQALRGTSTTAALLQITTNPPNNGGGGGGGNGTPSFDFGTWGTAASQTFYVINVGAQSATQLQDGGGLGAPFAYAGGYPGPGGTCTQPTLAAGSYCTVVVTFTPSGSGPASSTLSLSYGDGTATQSAQMQLSGTSTSNALVQIFDNPGQTQVGSGPHDFGTAGVAVQNTLYVVNTGAKVAALSDGGTLASGFSFVGGYPGAGGTCGATLASGASCSVVVTFTPSGNGVRQSTLTLGYTNGGANTSVTRALTGTATTSAVVFFQGWQYAGASPSTSFGTSGVAVSQTFTLENQGGTAATLSDGNTLAGMFGYTGSGFPGTGGDCGTKPLAPGGTCTVEVTFTPTGNGAALGVLTLDYDDGSPHSLAMQLSGTATTKAFVILGTYSGQTYASNQPFDFGTWGYAKSQTFYVINMGGAAAAVSDGSTLSAPFAYTGTGNFPGTNGTCNGAVPSGSYCTIDVTFTPSGTGSASSMVTLDYFSGSTPASATLGLQGTSTSAALLKIGDNTDGSWNGTTNDDLGTWGVATTHTLFVVNVGALTAGSMKDGATLGDEFSFAGGYPGGGSCGTSLASKSYCTIIVTFSPSGTGHHASTATVSYNDGSQVQVATAGVQGTATNRALLSVSEFPSGVNCGDSCGPFDYGNEPVNGSRSQTFTVYNYGGSATTSLADDGILASPFVYDGVSGFPGGGSCVDVLASGGTCTVVVDFAPTTTGQFQGDLVLTYADGLGAAQTAGRKLMGSSP